MKYSEKLTLLRLLLVQEHLDGYILQRRDEFLNEYVAPYAERLAWLTGFTGSTGLAVILHHKAAVFSDGRYSLQMQQELDPKFWEHYHLFQHSPIQWLAEQNSNHIKLGYDPKIFSEKDLEIFKNNYVNLFPCKNNLIDKIWSDQPTYPAHPIVPHPIKYSGLTHHKKISKLQKELKKNKIEAYIFCDPASICWLLNIRGSDIPYTPIPLVYAILYQNKVILYAEPNQYSSELKKFLGYKIQLKSRHDLLKDLHHLINVKIGFDKSQTPIWFIQQFANNNVTLYEHCNPILYLKTCKNNIEQNGAINAHIRDGIAMCRFLYWLEEHGINKNEIEVAHQLNQFRINTGKDFYQEESFPAISAVGKNGAIIHYQATQKKCAILKENQLYLIDSGGQYKDGTTDITRTVWLGKDYAPQSLQEKATLVLKGHIALAAALFPNGTTGSRLDVLARYALWQQGLDYDHGTGHGVGSFLSVHEGPCRISSSPFSTALEEGMILSNEPGYYLPNHYGIRLENLLLVRRSSFKNFLKFQPLTLVPFDWKIIKTDLLTKQEKSWLKTYHQLILDKIHPFLNQDEQNWLVKVCTFI